MGQKLTKQDVRDAVQHAFEQTKAVSGGKNADYIPYLANVPSDLFGIAVCLPDGEIIAAGDTEYKFGIESVSKVPTAILTMNQYSPEEVLTKIGATLRDYLSTRSWRSCSKRITPRHRW